MDPDLRRVYNRFRRYLKEFSRLVFPRRVTFKKMGSEVQEHFEVIGWMFGRIFAPVAAFYIAVGFLLGMNVIASTLLGLIIFFYSSFLPDIDSLFIKMKTDSEYAMVTRSGRINIGPAESPWHTKYLLLCFAPVFVYWRVLKRIKLFTSREKAFHNLRALCIYSAFLLLIGFVIYSNIYESLFFAFFGSLGYYSHLFVDKAATWV